MVIMTNFQHRNNVIKKNKFCIFLYFNAYILFKKNSQHMKMKLDEKASDDVIGTMPWFRWLATGFSLQRSGSIRGQSVWVLWWTEWQWDRFFSGCFRFLLSSFHRCSTSIHPFIHQLTYTLSNWPSLRNMPKDTLLETARCPKLASKQNTFQKLLEPGYNKWSVSNWLQLKQMIITIAFIISVYVEAIKFLCKHILLPHVFVFISVVMW